MSFTFRPAKRENVWLLLGFAGGTGSGKTYSAMRVARGIAGKEPFHVIDTENDRALVYADEFDFLHGNLGPPFKPSRYAEAVKEAAAGGAKVIVVDSTSHSWTGEGGVLEWHDRLEGGDARKKMTAWIEPKADHRKFVDALLQVKAHVILCFRAAPKVDMVRGEGGRIEIVPKASLTGLDGWMPLCDPQLPFELLASFLLMADAPGVPRPIKIPEKLAPFVPLDARVDEEVGAKLAAWALGGAPGASAPPSDPAAVLAPLVAELTQIVEELGAGPSAERIAGKLAEPDAKAWLEDQIRGGRVRLADAANSTAAGEGTPDGSSGEAAKQEAVAEPEPAAVEPEPEPAEGNAVETIRQAVDEEFPEEPEPEDFASEPREGLMAAADVAGAVLIPRGTHTGKSIADLAENGKWLKWAIEHPASWEGEETFYEGLKLFVRERVPDVWKEVKK